MRSRPDSPGTCPGPIRQCGDPVADLLVVGAVLASSWCYVEGAVVTRVFPGWQVISWVVVLALPVTVPASIALWVTTSGEYETTGHSGPA